MELKGPKRSKNFENCPKINISSKFNPPKSSKAQNCAMFKIDKRKCPNLDKKWSTSVKDYEIVQNYKIVRN